MSDRLHHIAGHSMRPLLATLALILLTTAAVMASGCKAEPQVKVVWEGEGDEDEEAEEAPARTESELREAFEKKKEARKNAPEPKLDPNEPREKFEVVWRLGGNRLQSIYGERAEMIAMLERLKLDDKAEKKIVKGLIRPLTEFGIGRNPSEMETAAADVCKIIEKARVPAEALMEKGTPEVERISAVYKELDAKAEAGEEILQKTWDKLEEELKRWSQPVTAGKRILVVIKSILEEAHVLAEHGPRRAQLGLRDCLTKVAEKPFALEMTQTQLEKTLERSRWYRDMR